MVFALIRLQLLEVVLQDFSGRLDDTQRRAELMGYHRNEMAPQLSQLFLSGQRPEQFDFGLLALRDVETCGNDVRLAVDFDDVGRDQQRPHRAPAGASLALELTHRTIALEVRPELRPVLQTQPGAQFLCVVPDNIITTQPIPPYKSVVHFDIFFVAQPRNRHERRAGAKGRAEARLALPQPRFAFAQEMFSPRAI